MRIVLNLTLTQNVHLNSPEAWTQIRERQKEVNLTHDQERTNKISLNGYPDINPTHDNAKPRTLNPKPEICKPTVI